MPSTPDTVYNVDGVAAFAAEDRQGSRLNIAEQALASFRSVIRTSRELIFAAQDSSQRDIRRDSALELIGHEERLSSDSSCSWSSTENSRIDTLSNGSINSSTPLRPELPSSNRQAFPIYDEISRSSRGPIPNDQLPSHPIPFGASHYQPSLTGSYEPHLTIVEAIQLFRNSETAFAQRFLETRDYKETVTVEAWIMNRKWLKVASPESSFSQAEMAFSTNNHQAGMIATDIALLSAPAAAIRPLHNSSAPSHVSTPTQVSVPTIVQIINLHLIRSCAFLACDELDRALKSAETGFAIAAGELIYYMMSKSQLYRGLCLMKMARWKEASDAFTRAANVRGWASKVANLKCVAEKNLLEEMKKKGSFVLRSGMGTSEL